VQASCASSSVRLALLHNRKNEGKSAEDVYKALEDYRWKISELDQTTNASSNLPLARLGHWLHWSCGGAQARQLLIEGHLRRPRELKEIMPRDVLGRFVEICGSHLAHHMCIYTVVAAQHFNIYMNAKSSISVIRTSLKVWPRGGL
jgi:hypothetical protein